MDKKLLRDQYYSQIGLLRIIINSWELIPGSPSDEFDTLANKLLGHLHRGADIKKIQNILASDLATIYGLYIQEADTEAYAHQIMLWWLEQ